MSVREEEGRKNNCSTSRRVGLAAAAIGVGVGAALYYYFNKRAEVPASEGSTSQDWDVDGPQAFPEEEQARLARERLFRERTWTLEECAICFDVMLKDHHLMTLPCTHNFHIQCIGPWLQEHRTCPVCRKAAE